MKIFRGLVAVLAVVVGVRIASSYLAPLLAPLAVVTILVGLYLLIRHGPGGFFK